MVWNLPAYCPIQADLGNTAGLVPDHGNKGSPIINQVVVFLLVCVCGGKVPSIVISLLPASSMRIETFN